MCDLLRIACKDMENKGHHLLHPSSHSLSSSWEWTGFGHVPSYPSEAVINLYTVPLLWPIKIWSLSHFFGRSKFGHCLRSGCPEKLQTDVRSCLNDQLLHLSAIHTICSALLLIF